MSKTFDKIQFRYRFIRGYGGPDVHEVRVVYENRELDLVKCHSEWEAATTQEKLRAKWKESIKAGNFERAVKRKKQASALCSVCGGDTLDGITSCVDKIFCRNCTGFIEQAKADYAARRRKQEESWEEEQRQRDEAYDAEVEDARKGFHWRDDWYFRRMPDGSVCVSKLVRVGSDGERMMCSPRIVIPAPEWASIVCSVSADNETGPRWEAAQDFHGRVKTP